MLEQILKRYNIHPTKKLGQNFLIDENIAWKIVACAGDLTGKNVLEIGPGTGALTRLLLQSNPASVIAVEYDNQCASSLQNLVQAFPERFKLVLADALKIQEEDLAPAGSVLISNLPYNISVILLLKWLKKIQLFDSLVLMVQHEVAARITAKPHSKDYGIVSVLTQYLCDARIAFNVPRTAFFPSPNVESSLVVLRPKSGIAQRLLIYEKLESVCCCLFNHRRKMIRNTLKVLTNDIQSVLGGLQIKPESRPEDLTVDDFERLAKAIV